jgi:hypothetical protein
VKKSAIIKEATKYLSMEFLREDENEFVTHNKYICCALDILDSDTDHIYRERIEDVRQDVRVHIDYYTTVGMCMRAKFGYWPNLQEQYEARLNFMAFLMIIYQQEEKNELRS